MGVWLDLHAGYLDTGGLVSNVRIDSFVESEIYRISIGGTEYAVLDVSGGG